MIDATAELWIAFIVVVMLSQRITPGMIKQLHPDKRVVMNGAYQEYELDPSRRYYSRN